MLKAVFRFIVICTEPFLPRLTRVCREAPPVRPIRQTGTVRLQLEQVPPRCNSPLLLRVITGLARNMSVTPPEAVRGMQELERELFRTSLLVPVLTVPITQVARMTSLLKKHMLKVMGVRPVAVLPADHAEYATHRLVLLDPGRCAAPGDLPEQARAALDECGAPPGDRLQMNSVTLGYENFKVDEVLQSVLPQHAGVSAVSGFSLIGHVAHLNLREEHAPYKSLIGQVILDKIPQVRTVVNKLNTIDNTFRNFQMEVLAGDNDFVTVCKEHGVAYEMDFSKVYWNPRLSTEHQRIVGQLTPNCVVFDAFAGIGPFAVPAAKEGCTVFANDLNPESHKWLEANAKRNKVTGRLTAFNLDGRAFIRNIMGPYLEDLSGKSYTGKVFLIMNLPAIAVEFLDSLKEFVTDEVPCHLLPHVRCYCFEKDSGSTHAVITDRVRNSLGSSLPPSANIHFVRNVAPSKDMFCIEFQLPAEVACTATAQSKSPELKRARVEEACRS